jgi:predicted kinase
MKIMEKVLILARGCPGSGKSSFAKLLGNAICTADDFHMKDGKYCWTQENAGAAHLWCQNKCMNFMKNDISPIIVANTNTTVKEMKPYYDMAADFGYKIFSIIIENRHGGVNEHNVPEETLKKMVERFDIKLL